MSAVDQPLPAGTVTFLFTDIERSTQRWEADPERMRGQLALHRRTVNRVLAEHAGVLVKDTGDGIFAVFASADDAIAAAIDLQIDLAASQADDDDALQVRAGVHTGDAFPTGQDYFGPPVNRCARIMGVAWGGQIVVSDDVRAADRRHAFRDLGRHRLKDLGDAITLHQVVAAGLRDEFPPVRSLDRLRTNLPTLASTFVGRDDDIERIAGLVCEGPIVSLVGFGGVGKTTCALHVAASVAERFPDGVWFVDLASVSDSEFVARAVAGAAQIAEQPGRPWIAAIESQLGGSHTLIVLDNCEQVLDAAAETTATLVARGGGLTVLTTSRTPLGVPGEVVHRLDPLPVTSDEGPSAAVRLFLLRAAERGVTLAGDEAELAAVGELCQRLDGIPLAIELAAARTVVLTPSAIVAHLHDRFRVLRQRSGSERQRSLEAMVVWSRELLSEDARSLFDTLSVFAGSFDLMGAVAVAEQTDDVEMIELMTELVDHSIVQRTGPASARFRMLETLREYGRRELVASGRDVQVEDRLLHWAAGFVESARSGLDGPEQQRWLGQVADELDNLRAALEWATRNDASADALATGLQIATGLYRFWYLGNVREGERWLSELTGRSDGHHPDARVSLASLRTLLGDVSGAAVELDRALSTYDRVRDRRARAYALHHLGRARWNTLAPDALRDLFDESLVIMKAEDDAVGIALDLMLLLTWELVHGSADAARRLGDELLAIARGLGNPHLLAHALELAAVAEVELGRLESGRQGLAEAIPLYQGIGNRTCAHHCLVNVANWSSRSGDLATAMVLIAATERLHTDHGIVVPAYEDVFRAVVVDRCTAGLDAVVAAENRREGLALRVDDALARSLAAVTTVAGA